MEATLSVMRARSSMRRSGARGNASSRVTHVAVAATLPWDPRDLADSPLQLNVGRPPDQRTCRVSTEITRFMLPERSPSRSSVTNLKPSE